MVSPGIVGVIADEVGAWGPVLQVTAIFPILAVGMIYAMLPETRGKDLSETAAMH